MPMQIRRTATANNPPTTLAEGQLAVEMANPLRLWCGVPTGIDASGRRLLIPASVLSGATNPATPAAGDFFYNTATDVLMYYDGTAWQPVLFDAPSDGELYARRSGVWEAVPIPEVPADTSVVPIGGRLAIVGSSPSGQIVYRPFNGSWIRIAGQDYAIPSTGITSTTSNVFIDGVTGQTLSNNTQYYVYLFDDSGTPTIDFSTVGHGAATVAGNIGTEIKLGDESRTFIGLVYVFNNLFSDDGTRRFVRSWLNRPRVTLVGTNTWTVGGGGGWVTMVNVSAVGFVDDPVLLTTSGAGANPTGTAFNRFSVETSITAIANTGYWSGTSAIPFTTMIASNFGIEGMQSFFSSAQADNGSLSISQNIVVTLG